MLLALAVVALLSVWTWPTATNWADWVMVPVMLWFRFSVWEAPSRPVAVMLLETALAARSDSPGE